VYIGYIILFDLGLVKNSAFHYILMIMYIFSYKNSKIPHRNKVKKSVRVAEMTTLMHLVNSKKELQQRN